MASSQTSKNRTEKSMSKGEVRQINGKRVASPEYRSWQAMKQRCMNTKSKDYQGYGSIGISICDDWESFSLFLADMGRRPTLRHTLERRDARGHYCPDNCIWADKRAQARNRPDFVKLTMRHASTMRDMYAGGLHTYNSIAAMFGVAPVTVGRVIRKEAWVYE